MKTVVVGMSGGVDSSVTALLLKEQGYRVIGLFMKNWEEDNDDGVCQSTEDYEDVIRVCKQLDIPYYSVNFVKEYWERVFSRSLEDFRAGLTPNPDVLCNREIKFDLFLKKALELGADFLATGHYCRNVDVEGTPCLAKGVDGNKDQSYFLYTIKSAILEKVLFPLGDMPKSEVRRIAKEHGLATAEKKDSTGICFVGKRDFKPFLSKYIPNTQGNFETLAGKIVGSHDGYPFYTIGQRRGLDIGGAGDAWFVVGKDPQRNVVFVEQGSTHPALLSSTLTAKAPSWVHKPPSAPFRCTAKTRYRQSDLPCTIDTLDDNTVTVTFDSPQKAITPGQAIVFYSDALCLGGATITANANRS